MYVVHFAIWYHLYNLKNVKNIHGGVLLRLKLYYLDSGALSVAYLTGANLAGPGTSFRC